MIAASSSTHSAVGAQQGLVLAPADLVDERSVGRADRRAARLSGQQRHLPDHRAAPERVDVQVGAVLTPQHDLDLAVRDDE